MAGYGGTTGVQIVIPATGVTAGSYTNASVTVGSDGRVTAASTGSGGGATDLSKLTQYTTTGLSVMGLTSAGSAIVYADDFTDGGLGWKTKVDTLAAMAGVAGSGGLFGVTTGSASGYSFATKALSDTAAHTLKSTTSTKKWYFAVNAKLSCTTAPGSGVGFLTNNGSYFSNLETSWFWCGTDAALSATKYIFKARSFADGGGSDTSVTGVSTIDLDSNYHTFEAWWDGTTQYQFRVDGETWVTVAKGSVVNTYGGLPHLHAYPTAAASTTIADWGVWIAER